MRDNDLTNPDKWIDWLKIFYKPRPPWAVISEPPDKWKQEGNYDNLKQIETYFCLKKKMCLKKENGLWAQPNNPLSGHVANLIRLLHPVHRPLINVLKNNATTIMKNTPRHDRLTGGAVAQSVEHPTPGTSHLENRMNIKGSRKSQYGDRAQGAHSLTQSVSMITMGEHLPDFVPSWDIIILGSKRPHGRA